MYVNMVPRAQIHAPRRTTTADVCLCISKGNVANKIQVGKISVDFINVSTSVTILGVCWLQWTLRAKWRRKALPVGQKCRVENLIKPSSNFKNCTTGALCSFASCTILSTSWNGNGSVVKKTLNDSEFINIFRVGFLENGSACTL